MNVTQSEIMAFDIKGFILEEGQGGKEGTTYLAIYHAAFLVHLRLVVVVYAEPLEEDLVLV